MKTLSIRPKLALSLSALCLASVLGLLASCESTIANRNPLGQAFPAVQGSDLYEQRVEIPAAFAGQPAILLLGYAQNAQFDADRWLFGLLQAGTPATIREVPTIRGFVPSLLSGRIDSGMRSGIPSEDWGSVVTVYGSEARQLVSFTGNTQPRNMRVVLLDGSGQTVWFHDRGFSAGKLLELDRATRALRTESEQ